MDDADVCVDHLRICYFHLFCPAYLYSLNAPRARLQFLTPAHGDLVANLDAVATADFTIFSLSGNEEVGSWGETCIRSLASLGIGEGAVRGVVSVSQHISIPEH